VALLQPGVSNPTEDMPDACMTSITLATNLKFEGTVGANQMSRKNFTGRLRFLP
jgi:hypothetical protein